jgi:phosphoglycerate dehydrogenase-like enzyme
MSTANPSTERAPLRVLSHFGGPDTFRLAAELDARVEIVAVPMQGPIDDAIAGEVLVTIPEWADNTDALLRRGVRWLHYISTGVDRVDFDSLPSDLLVTNSRGAAAVPISEWVVAMLLAFEKRLPEIWIDSEPENWRADPRLGTLDGREVAIVGFGSIGEAIASRLAPFGARVRGLRRTVRPSPMAHVEIVSSLDDALEGADHVVLATPLTDATHHLIDADAFARMKTGVHFVNIARGGLVDQDALRAALDDGTVAMAALDAVDPEPLPAGHWMYSHPKVRLSAHDSWSWPRAYRIMFERFATNLEAYLDGRPLPDLIDRDQRY